MTQRERRLEAPHRRLRSSPRLLERTAVVAYRVTAAVLAHVPPRLSRGLIALFAQAGYLAWPAKRRASARNFAHVLGLPAGHWRVHALALRAYRSYARYVVELMRLPSRPDHERAAAVDAAGVAEVEALWRDSGRPMILCAAHVGNNEAVVAGLAGQGYPIAVVADDSSFPELFELLRRQRESWGVQVIPWRNLRELFGVLRRNGILALLVDWGYKDDGIPVRLFGEWTTFPAGPATLAAKTDATLALAAIRRTPEGRYRVDLQHPIRVPSLGTADLQRATQAMADGLQELLAAAPEQWYSFKPVWPATDAAKGELAERAAAMLAGEGEGIVPLDARGIAVAAGAAGTGAAATPGADRAGEPRP